MAYLENDTNIDIFICKTFVKQKNILTIEDRDINLHHSEPAYKLTISVSLRYKDIGIEDQEQL